MSKSTEKKYKLNKRKKAGAIIGALLIVATGGAVKFTSNVNVSDTNNKKSTETILSSDYIDIKKSNELVLYDTDRNTTNINISNYNYLNFMDKLEKEDYSFSMAKYYGLDEALEMYNNSKYEKSMDSNLLDENGKLDPQKLLDIVKKNNAEYMSQGVNSINTFYSETSPEDSTKICNMIAEIVNSKFNNTDIKKMANTLTKLTIFNRTGCASNAYVTNDLTLVYNPSMSDMYAEMQEITGNQSNKEMTLKSVITHENMHLLQYENNDLKSENGLETGICRTYNLPNEEQKVRVDSLYYPWILEASAELGMAEYLNVNPGTYDKKISYAKSYNLSNFNKLDKEEQAIEKVAFNNTLEEAYKNLELTTEEEQKEFLRFMYSVEITQSDPEDFWENYKAITGTTPTEEEMLNIRMEIRQEVVKYLSKNFYSNLADSIQENKITDLDSVFYLIRIWEIDSYKHLDYTKESTIEYAKDFIQWQDNVQNNLFTAIANSSNLSTEKIKTLYDEYHIQANINGTIYDNCDLSKLNDYPRNNILTAKKDYATSNFVRNSNMLNYINSNQATTVTETKTTK